MDQSPGNQRTKMENCISYLTLIHAQHKFFSPLNNEADLQWSNDCIELIVLCIDCMCTEI